MVLGACGTGIWHVAVEVFGQEWSFGASVNDEDFPGPSVPGTGVFGCQPRSCSGHSYACSFNMGDTSVDPTQVYHLILSMACVFKACGYDLVRRNCVIFSNELCRRLGVGSVPDWCINLSHCGATIKNLAEWINTPLMQAGWSYVSSALRSSCFVSRQSASGCSDDDASMSSSSASPSPVRQHAKKKKGLLAQRVGDGSWGLRERGRSGHFVVRGLSEKAAKANVMASPQQLAVLKQAVLHARATAAASARHMH